MVTDPAPISLQASPDDPRLLRGIRTASVQSQAAELVRLALQALADLRNLDDSLYDQFVATRQAPATVEATAASLARLWRDTFGGLTALLAFCARLVAAEPPAEAPAADPAFDELDFGEEGGAPAASDGGLDLGATDIGTLLDGIGGLEEAGGRSDQERWAEVVEEIGALEYGLRSQQADAEERMEVALGAGQVRQVLGLLDDTQSAASEGVHAIIAAVYAAFVPEADPALLVPGYLTSLGRALLVRRGLAALRAQIEPLNAELQGPDPERHAEALDAVRRAMSGFVTTAVCRAMRAADRWQMVQFEQQVTADELPRARQTCEGLAKYLESLASINQREVLIVHDQRKLDEMRELLAGARQLLDLSPRTAVEMLAKAQETAHELRGRNPVFDQRLGQVAALALVEETAGTLEWLERLEALLAVAGV
jgi:hypothetical protein